MIRSVRFMTKSAVIAAAYLVLTLPLAQFAFGPIQFRLSEALTVLAALTPSAIPGLFLGCLLSNLMNPQSLGPVDIVFGSLATLLSAWLTWRFKLKWLSGSAISESKAAGSKFFPSGPIWLRYLVVFSPAVWVNALVVGTYLPLIIPDLVVTTAFVVWTVFSIFVSQAVVVYLIGLPLYLALRKMNVSYLEH